MLPNFFWQKLCEVHKKRTVRIFIPYLPANSTRFLLTFAMDSFIIMLNRNIVRCFTLKEYGAKSAAGLSDEELVGLYLAGDDTAFEAIASRYLGLISSVAAQYRNLSPDMDASDLIQEGMLTLLNVCRSYNPDGDSSFKNYLIRCFKNRLLSIRRHVEKKGNVPPDHIVSIEGDEDAAFDPTLSSPDELVETKEHIDHLHRILKDRLSDLEYRVAILHLSGCSYREIADQLNTSLKTIDNAQTRIRQKLSR